jgi:hypothetical protein
MIALKICLTAVFITWFARQQQVHEYKEGLWFYVMVISFCIAAFAAGLFLWTL